MLNAIAIIISKLPFRLLYLLSDFVYLIVYYVVRYRHEVVRKNLLCSFPEKTEKERKTIEKKFYRWFCDYFLETIKLLDMTPEKMKEHLEWRNVEELEKCYDKGQHTAIFLGHYCNWEWLTDVNNCFKKHEGVVCGMIYHPLRSDAFDELFIKIRSHLGSVCIKKKNILRAFVRYKKENRLTLFGYIADQSPKWENIHLWLDFMHQNTPVFTGAERIATKMNNAAFYCDMERPCRGKYIATFHKMTDTPGELNEFDITKDFFHRLETTIHRQPEFYLWTHNRWKRTMEGYREWERKKEEKKNMGKESAE